MIKIIITALFLLLISCSDNSSPRQLEAPIELATRLLQNAIDESPGALHLKRGTYLIDRPLFIRRSGMRIVGEGRDTIIRATSASFHLVRVEADSFELKQLSLEGAAVDESSEQYGVFTEQGKTGQNGNVEHVFFTGPKEGVGLNSGLVLDGANGWTISDNRFDRLVGFSSGRGYGILLRPGSQNLISNNYFTGSQFGGRHAIYLSRSSSDNLVVHNLVTGYSNTSISQYAYDWQPGNFRNRISSNLILNQNSGPNGSAGIDIHGNAGNHLIEGNFISGTQAPGILLRSTKPSELVTETVIKDNIVENTPYPGIVILGAKRTTVEGNVLRDTGLSEKQDYPGLLVGAFLGSSADRTIITNNSIFGDRHRAAITLNATTPVPTATTITFNYLEPGPLGQIELNGILAVAAGNHPQGPGPFKLPAVGR